MTAEGVVPPWWTRSGVLVFLLLLSLLPLLQPGLPPLTDLPGHVARWHIATAPDASPLHHYFRVEWAWVGNLGTDLLAVPLIGLFGPVGAGHVIAILIVALNVVGMIALSRAVHGRMAEVGLFALPLAFAWPFQMGFVNFELAQGAALPALAGWIALGKRGHGTIRAGLSIPVSLILWTCHSAGWGLFGLMAFGAEIAARIDRGDSLPIALRKAVLACLPLAAPLLPMLLAAPPGAGASASADWFNLPNKLLWIASTFRDRWQWIDLASLGVILFLLYVAWREPRLRFSRRLLLPALFVAIAFLILPRLMMGAPMSTCGSCRRSGYCCCYRWVRRWTYGWAGPLLWPGSPFSPRALSRSRYPLPSDCPSAAPNFALSRTSRRDRRFWRSTTAPACATGPMGATTIFRLSRSSTATLS